MAIEPITRAEQIMSGESLIPITREEMFLAKAAGQDVQTPTPITRKEMFLSQISGGSGGGSDTQSGNFKKKFMSFHHVKRTGVGEYDFLVALCSEVVVGHDEEILSTKTSDGIKVSTPDEYYFYFIEDENNLFIYADVYGTGTEEWLAVSAMVEGEFGGVLTDPNQTTPNALYVFFYYVEAE